MTKEEAISEIQKGKKITHKNFSPEEWVSQNSNTEERNYIFENGIECSQEEFWRCKLEDIWDSGWELWEEATVTII